MTYITATCVHLLFIFRLSFKVLKKSKDLFHKQHSGEVDLAHNKTKLAKIVVECRKEGIVNYSTPESLDQPGGPPKWERCRLQLVKATGGYMLEFYSPPKNQKVDEKIISHRNMLFFFTEKTSKEINKKS